jgi:hypothetical protein
MSQKATNDPPKACSHAEKKQKLPAVVFLRLQEKHNCTLKYNKCLLSVYLFSLHKLEINMKLNIKSFNDNFEISSSRKHTRMQFSLAPQISNSIHIITAHHKTKQHLCE